MCKKFLNYINKEIDDEIKAIIDEATQKSRETVRKYKEYIEKLKSIKFLIIIFF